MSQSKAKYHRLHLEEVTDGTSFEKHASNKLLTTVSIVIVSALAVSLFFLIIGSKFRNKEGEYI